MIGIYLRLISFIALLAVSSCFAGNLGFRVTYFPQFLEVMHMGDEHIFELRLFGLDKDQQWKWLSSSAGSLAYEFLPRQTAMARHAANGFNPLNTADPVLFLFKDQSGSQIAHLAWRNTPSLPPELLIFQRRGAYVSIRHAPKTTQPYRRTWAISVPLQGISALAQSPDTTLLPPAPPTEIEWNLAHINEQTLTVDTGPGQGGIWLIHEAHNGQLSLQVIGNGILMGSEQKPAWLMFLKHHGYELALGLVVFGWLTIWMVRRLKCKARWVALLTAMRARFQLGTGV